MKNLLIMLLGVGLLFFVGGGAIAAAEDDTRNIPVKAVSMMPKTGNVAGIIGSGLVLVGTTVGIIVDRKRKNK